jgi:hypothetical protein
VSLISMNPAMMERVAQARMAEMRRVVTPRSGGTGRPAMASAAPGPGWREAGAGHPVAVRRAIGWFLVRVGLRLALSRPHSASLL